jgi:pimeloyl-ACP methyl ester carboxylesterase
MDAPPTPRAYSLDGFVERRLGPLHVALGGREDAPPLVLFHGLGASWRTWTPLLAPFAKQYRVIAFDLPGFGRSEELGTREYELAMAGDVMDAALEKLGVRDFALMGHSLGGGVAVHYAAQRNDRVKALILIAPAGFFRHKVIPRLAWRSRPLHWATRQFNRRAAPIIAHSDRVRSAVFSRLLESPMSQDPELLRMLARESTLGRATGPAGITIVSESRHPDVPNLTMPTLLIWGRQDRVVSAGVAPDLAESLPDCRGLHLLERCGHLVMWEKPDEVHRLTTEFLSSIPY